MTIGKKTLPTRLLMLCVFGLFVFFTSLIPAYAQELEPEIYDQLEYRHIGPVGNRVIAVVGVPGDSNIYYVGAASGGIFKTIDGGVNWEPIFDEAPVSSVGSLAIAPSDPNIIWAGTGETFIRSNVSQGMGIYKSTDAGKTWKLMGLEKTGRIGRVIIHPQDPNIVFAAAMGHCYGPQEERGVFRTKDGGETWEKVLFVDENTGASDIAMDPNNPRILFAGMWPMLIRTWGRWSGGPGGGLYVSRDTGTTWERIEGHGLPETEIGKVAVAVAPTDSNVVYALFEAAKEGLWRSDDGGKNWKHVNPDHALINRPHYYTRCTVATDDAKEIYTVAGAMRVSYNGGETIEKFKVLSGDNHDMWIDPLMPDRMAIGNDAGVSISTNHGKTWLGARLPIAQMYHATVDNQIPYCVYGNRQDGPSCRGPSNSLTGRGGIQSGMWISVGGGESGIAVPDPVEPNIVWSGNVDGLLDRTDMNTGHSRAVTVWPESIQNWPAKDVKYRFQWNFPIAISPHDHNKVYVGSQYLHVTTNGGQSWTIISPDLSTNDKSKQTKEGGLTPDDLIPTYTCTLFAIAESPLEEGLIWAGTNDGLVQLTRDGGANWTNVTGSIPDLPPWGTVNFIEPSRHDAGTCYVAFDMHQINIRDPYVYRTNDYGKTWKRIVEGIPKSELSYTHCVREDPVRKGLLYLGTENAVYVSFDDGDKWQSLQNNLPHAPAHWLVIQDHFNDLVVATYGRGFWILDDLTPLQQVTPDVLESDIHLFEPRPAYRFRMVQTPWGSEGHPNDDCLGDNPPYGASINYYLKSEVEDSLTITILDEQGQIVRTFEEPEDEKKGDVEQGLAYTVAYDFYDLESPEPTITKKAGINRLWWDLRYDSPEPAKLRTSPVGHPHVTVGPKGWRPIGRGDLNGPLVAPGEYTVKLAVGEKEFTQKLTVTKDPNSAGSANDIEASTRVLLEIVENYKAAVDMVNKSELIRKQISDLEAPLEGHEKAEAIMNAGKELDQKITDFEDNLYSVGFTGMYERDGLRWPDKLLVKLAYLSGSIGESDFPPTDQQLEVHEKLTNDLNTYKARFTELINTDLAAFNNLLKESAIPNIIVP